jgi:hypothetical protein
MEQLSSCYFCGDALDASLDEYPVVPASLRPSAGDRRTVVLCGDCKRKLDAVMEAVVDAVDEHDPESGSVSDIEATLGDDEDVLRSVDDEGSRSADDDSSDGRAGTGANGSSGERERKYTSSRRAGFTGDDRESRSGGHRSADDDGPSPDRDPDEAGDEENAEDDEADPDVTLTRLENTKVMRLLQNREFPVERDDFVTVASSAYEVSPRDCDKVVDLAVEHDLLREEGGQLYAGPRWQ